MEKEEKIKLKEEKKKEKQKAKAEKLEKKKQKLPKEISQDLLKGMVKNIVIAAILMLYFFALNVAITSMNEERLLNDLKVFAGMFLVLGIYLFERSYKKDSGKMAISGIEAIILCGHTLSIMHVVTKFEYDFRLYLLTSSYIFAIYYVLKSIVMYTKGRRDYLNSLSDIHEILQDEPKKKEAVKRKKVKSEEKADIGEVIIVDEKTKQKAKTQSKGEEDIKKDNKSKTKQKTNTKNTTKTTKQMDKTTTKKPATKKEQANKTKNKNLDTSKTTRTSKMPAKKKETVKESVTKKENVKTDTKKTQTKKTSTNTKKKEVK